MYLHKKKPELQKILGRTCLYYFLIIIEKFTCLGNLFKWLDKNYNGINANKTMPFFLLLFIICIFIFSCWRIVSLFSCTISKNFQRFYSIIATGY